MRSQIDSLHADLGCGYTSVVASSCSVFGGHDQHRIVFFGVPPEETPAMRHPGALPHLPCGGDRAWMPHRPLLRPPCLFSPPTQMLLPEAGKRSRAARCGDVPTDRLCIHNRLGLGGGRHGAPSASSTQAGIATWRAPSLPEGVVSPSPCPLAMRLLLFLGPQRLCSLRRQTCPSPPLPFAHAEKLAGRGSAPNPTPVWAMGIDTALATRLQFRGRTRAAVSSCMRWRREVRLPGSTRSRGTTS